MKTIKLGKKNNIKTLSKRDFELYSQKVPLIVDSILKKNATFIRKKEFCFPEFLNSVGKFYLAGDFLSAIKLATSLEKELGFELEFKDYISLLSLISLLYVLSGCTRKAKEYMDKINETKKIEDGLPYRFYLLTKIFYDYKNRDFLPVYLNAKRLISVFTELDPNDPVFVLQPKYHLIQKLIRMLNDSAIFLAENEKIGSEKKRLYFQAVDEALNRYRTLKSKTVDFFYFCELSKMHSNFHNFGKAKAALDEAYGIIKGKKQAFEKYSFNFYESKAHYFSKKNDFSEAYKQIKLAYRASFNVSDVNDEMCVIESFLKIAADFSNSDPQLRKHASEFYMQGNSLLKQFINFLEEKDWYTGKNHSAKVASMSYLIAKKLLTVHPYMKNYIDVQSVFLAGYVHDIGKVKIPWLLINKISKLEEFEVDYLMAHVIFGKEILEDLNFNAIAKIIFQHHESPDGTGYPEGSTNVSVEANIISLADSFEAMTTSNRKYKKPKSLETAKKEIISLSGSKFYPEIIEAFKSIKTEELKSFLK